MSARGAQRGTGAEHRWRLGARKLPRIRFGSGQVHEDNPAVTYYLIVLPTLVLVFLGMVMGFSAQTVTNIARGNNPYLEYVKPAIIIVVAVIVAMAASRVPRNWWYVAAIPMFAVSVVFQALVLSPLGMAQGGNANWVRLPGGFTAQPSELLKLALIILLAQLLERHQGRLGDLRTMAKCAAVPMLIALGAVMLGRDMGTAMVVFAAAVGALFIAGLPKKWFAVLGALAGAAAVWLVMSNPTRIRRILAVLPGTAGERDLSAPEQIDHSLWALGSGGLTGLGVGASREKWNYLQAAHTDFILAIIGEELGLGGTLLVLVCVGALVTGMMRVCRNAQDPFVAVAAGGTATWIGAQTVINVLSVTGMGPVIGVPLPLVSYGGSSFLFTALAVGVVASFARAGAGMPMVGRPDEASAGRDPRVAPKKRSAR